MRNWNQTLAVMQSPGAPLTNSTTATSLITVAAKKRLDAGFFYVTGRKIQIKAHGKITTIATTPGTLQLSVRFTGAPDAASPTVVVVATGPAMVLSTTAKTDVLWTVDWELTCFAIGASANLQHGGEFKSEAAGATTVVGEMKTIGLSASPPAVGTNFDASQIQVVDFFGAWAGGSNPTASNAITCQQFELISKN